jgi:hypothetical protein
MEVVFLGDSKLKTMKGFAHCVSLARVEIPDSVEEIHPAAFMGCTALTEVLFGLGSRLRRFGGFHRCTSLCRMKLPASVEILESVMYAHLDELWTRVPVWGYGIGPGFARGDFTSRELVLSSGTRVRPHTRDNHFQAFIGFEDENDLKRPRREVHLRTARFCK